MVVYLYQQGRAVGLHQKGIQPVAPADGDAMAPIEALGLPDYGIGMQILVDLGVRDMRLITDNPVRRSGLGAYGLEIAELVPLAERTREQREEALSAARRDDEGA